jgi:hypothetical protein
MIYGPISAHNSQHRDNPSLWVPHLKGTCPLRCSARDRCTLAQQIDCPGRDRDHRETAKLSLYRRTPVSVLARPSPRSERTARFDRGFAAPCAKG